MKTLHSITILCLAGSLISARLDAASTSEGDFTVNAITGENGDLTVEGSLGVDGAVDFVNGIHFGTTLETPPLSAMEFLYGEDGANYTLTLKSRRANTAFLWQDNALGTLKTKMKLGADNVLTLYKSNGDAGIVLDPSSAGVTFNGQTLLTQDAAESLFMPVAPTSFAVGEGTTASGIDSTAMGHLTTASGDYSTAMGDGTSATGYGATAMGGLTPLWYGGSFSTASGDGSTAMGLGVTASGYCATAMGFGVTAWGDSSTAMGANSYAGHRSTAMGDGAYACGYASTAMGYAASACADFSTAMGEWSYANGCSSTAMGFSAYALGDYSTAMGYGTGASGFYSTAMGYYTSANGNSSTAMGDQTKANAYASLALGRNNVGSYDAAGGDTQWIETDPILEIGNGEDDWRIPSNAVTVFKNGKLRTGNVAEFKGGVRVPPQGDLSMGDFTAGNNPADLNPTLGLKYQNE